MATHHVPEIYGDPFAEKCWDLAIADEMSERDALIGDLRERLLKIREMALERQVEGGDGERVVARAILSIIGG